MPDFDGGFKIVARNAGTGLARLAHVTVDAWEAIGDTVQTTERLADRAFRARHGSERFVVYFEAHTSWVESAPWNMLAKSGLLSERERLPTLCLLFLLIPKGHHPQGEFRLTALGEPTQQVWIREVCLWQVKPEDWWRFQPGLLALYPLCDHGLELPRAVTEAAESIRRQEMDSIRRADLLTTLGIFASLRDRHLDWPNLIGKAQMKESPFFEQVMADGQLVGWREAILDSLDRRFGADAAKEFAASLDEIRNLEQLRELNRIAIKCRGINSFRKSLSEL